MTKVARTPFEVEREKGPFVCVIDTCVGLEFYLRADIDRAVEQARRVGWRVQNARETLWLVMALDHVAARTLGFTEEFKRKHEDLAPRNSKGAAWPAAMSRFVKPTVAARWVGVTSSRDEGLRGNKCDEELVRMAAEHGLPIVSRAGDMPDRARDAGVPCFSPGEFAESLGLSFEAARRRFFERYDSGLLPFVHTLLARYGPFGPCDLVRDRCQRDAKEYGLALLNVRDFYAVLWDASITWEA